jgi:hypothetical protein
VALRQPEIKFHILIPTIVLSESYMKVHSLIDYDFADIKIYKSKTRLEIRLKRNFIQNSKYFLSIFDYDKSI